MNRRSKGERPPGKFLYLVKTLYRQKITFYEWTWLPWLLVLVPADKAISGVICPKHKYTQLQLQSLPSDGSAKRFFLLPVRKSEDTVCVCVCVCVCVWCVCVHVCMHTHILHTGVRPHLPKKDRPRCYAKSPTAQDAFEPTPGFVSCAGGDRGWG